MATPHGTETALHLAISVKNWSRVHHLLKKQPQLVNACPDGKSPIRCAIVEAPEELILKMLEVASEETVNILDNDGRSLLHWCTQRGFDECIKRILKKSNLHVNLTDGWVARTPLQFCARSDSSFKQQLHTVIALISSGADISLKDKDGRTAAELYEFNDCVKYDKSTRAEEKRKILHVLKGEVPRHILVYNYDAVEIYLKALERGGVQYQRCNLTVVGQARAGKTSLIKILTGQRFNAKENETDGIVTTMTCKIDENDMGWKLDTADEIGNAITSEGLSLKIYDFAGQEIYYTTHPMFLMSRTVFILVFDLSLDLNTKAVIGKDCRIKNVGGRVVMKFRTLFGHKENVKVYELTNLDFIIFWLSSIYAHTEENRQREGTQAKQLSPPVFIVGTHENSLPGNKSQRKSKVEEIFEIIRTSLQGKPFLKHVVTRYYAVDSSLKKDVEIQELQRHIMEVVKEEPYMNELIPITWLDLELSLEEKRKENLMEMTKVRDEAANCGVNDSELNVFLQFQHDIGNCVYFENKVNVDDPSNHYIILNQMWLNGIFIRVITIKPAQEQCAQFSESWDRLARYGLLDEKLARHVWREYKIDPNLLFTLMSRFDLLCEMQFSTEESACRQGEGTRVFCLPCCLSETIEAPAVVDDDKCTVRFFVDFAGFLPVGMFFRLMVRAIRFSQEHGGHDQRLSRHSAGFYVDQDHHLVLRIFSKDRSRMEVIIVHVAGGDAEPTPAVCQMVFEFLKTALKDLCSIWRNDRVKFTFGIQCDQCEDELHLHTFDECTRASRVSCGAQRMETERIQRLFVTGFDNVFIRETKNFHMIQSLIVGLGTVQMRTFFLMQNNLDEAGVGQFLIQEQQNGRFKGVRVFDEQKQKMFKTDADISKFDITLMMMLIRHCCGVSRPNTFWANPDEQDHSKLANLVRIREYRNMMLAHHHNNRIPASEFEDEWKKLTAIFQGIGVAVDDIDKYRQIV